MTSITIEESYEIEEVSLDEVTTLLCDLCGAHLTEDNEVMYDCIYECDRDMVSMFDDTQELRFDDD